MEGADGGMVFGSWIGSQAQLQGPRRKLSDPATGRPFGDVVDADEGVVSIAARAASDAISHVAEASPRTRARWLRELAKAIGRHSDRLARLETLCVGKPLGESSSTTNAAIAAIEHHADLLETSDLFRTRSRQSVRGGQVSIDRLPLGVIAHILPWNFPISMAAARIAMSIAVGVPCILKASELAPTTPVELGRLAAATSMPAGAVSVLVGGADVGSALIDCPEVAAVCFTGAGQHGVDVMKAAAKSLKPVTLELGGRCIGVVLPSADIDRAADALIQAAFANCGQSCAAATQILVHEKLLNAFSSVFAEKALRLRVGPGLSSQSEVGPLITAGARDRVAGIVDQARRRGAACLAGGSAPDDEDLRAGNFYEPTVLHNTSEGWAGLDEEPFGPVTVLNSFSDLADVVQAVNGSPFRLAVGVFGSYEPAMALARGLSVGVVWVNTYNEIAPDCPWGGFGMSGFGRILGEDGILEFTAPRQIYART